MLLPVPALAASTGCSQQRFFVCVFATSLLTSGMLSGCSCCQALTFTLVVEMAGWHRAALKCLKCNVSLFLCLCFSVCVSLSCCMVVIVTAVTLCWQHTVVCAEHGAQYYQSCTMSSQTGHACLFTVNSLLRPPALPSSSQAAAFSLQQLHCALVLYYNLRFIWYVFSISQAC